MTDRLINSVWWWVVMAMILTAGAATMLCACNGVLDMIAQRFVPGITELVLGSIAAVAALQLCRYRNDLT